MTNQKPTVSEEDRQGPFGRFAVIIFKRMAITMWIALFGAIMWDILMETDPVGRYFALVLGLAWCFMTFKMKGE